MRSRNRSALRCKSQSVLIMLTPQKLGTFGRRCPVCSHASFVRRGCERPTLKPIASDSSRRRETSCRLFGADDTMPTAAAKTGAIGRYFWHKPATWTFTPWLDKHDTVIRVRSHATDIVEAAVVIAC